jgi:nucleoside-specific outer membrane channel protein Tsx
MRRNALALFALFCICSVPAHAEEFSTTNIQATNAVRMHDPGYGYNTRGSMQTFTIEHFNTWKLGDHYAFIDILLGDHATTAGLTSGDRIRAYGEWCARLSLTKLSGRNLAAGRVKDLYVAGEIDSGKQYTARLAGVSADLDVPHFDTATVTAFVRDDNYNAPNVQVTLTWSRPVAIGKLKLTLAGYADVAGTDRDGIDIGAQPQLLTDLGSAFHLPTGRIAAGVEVYVHRNATTRVLEPQLLVKWTLK